MLPKVICSLREGLEMDSTEVISLGIREVNVPCRNIVGRYD